MLSGDPTDGGPLARIGWIDDAQQWIREAVRHRDLAFSKDLSQLNAGGRFALIRLPAEQGPAYWLKAVGPPNEHEFRVTKTLFERFPEHLPVHVVAREDWNAWVTEESGKPMNDMFAPNVLDKAVDSLATLQKKSIEHSDALYAAGCYDCRIPVLGAHLGELTEYLERAMGRQISTKVPRLDGHRLRELECILRTACARMQDLCIPDTLIHNDMNPGNILYDGSQCVFIDWAEAYIGNPFLTFQHLCSQISLTPAKAETCLPQMRHIYKRAWIECLTESQIDGAFRLMPILAAASYLYGRGDWLTGTDNKRPGFEGYVRSLARYIDRAARAPEFIEALCP
jgi:Phosphotransferase enzyme family